MAAAALCSARKAMRCRGGRGYRDRRAQRRQGRHPLPECATSFAASSRIRAWRGCADSMARKGRPPTQPACYARRFESTHDPICGWPGQRPVDHAGMITPAAQFSYERAMKLAPGHPAAPFFLGLALVRSGDRAGALALWRQILSEAPAEASWRPLVEDAVVALEAPPRK